MAPSDRSDIATTMARAETVLDAYPTIRDEIVANIAQALRGRESRFGSGLTVKQANTAADWIEREFGRSE